MKRQNIVFTFVTAAVSVGAAVTASTIAGMTFSPTAAAQTNAPTKTQTIVTTPQITQIAAKPQMKMTSTKTLATGQFVGAEHPTAGSTQIIMENGKRYVEFDQKFKSDDGPDLFVILHTESNPKNYQKENYVKLGRLQNVKGKQRYEIPADVELDDFQSVVIWCRQFNATFGFAPLS